MNELTLYVKDGGVTFWSKTERGIKAELRLQHHPYDTESWGVLIREAQVNTVMRMCYVKFVEGKIICTIFQLDQSLRKIKQ